MSNIDDAEDATAGEMRGDCIDAARATSPVSKLTTSTMVEPSGNPPLMMYSLPDMKEHQSTHD